MHERPAPSTTATPGAWRRRAWARWVWWRAAALLLLVTTPGVGDVLQGLVECATGIECCDGGCDDGGATGCSPACAHCKCCTHPRALPTTLQLLAPAPLGSEQTRIWRSESRLSSGYRAPPFRPPVG